MDAVTRDLTSVLFPETMCPPNTSYGDAHAVHKEFWSDPYSKNLRLDNVEIEVRMGRLKSRCFDALVSQQTYRKLIESLQQYTAWDAVTHERSSVAYFERRDDSLRAVTNSNGTVYVSKQRLMTSDFVIANAAYDFRISASLEIPVADRPSLDTSTRRIVRDRTSFTLREWRYDLTKVTEEDNTNSYQVEIEMVDPAREQLTRKDANTLSADLMCRLGDLFDVLEPDRDSMTVEHRRRKWY